MDLYHVQLAGTRKNSFKVGQRFAVLDDRTISVSSDLTGGGDLSANLTLALSPTGVNAGTYGGAASVPEFEVSATGRIISVVNRSITPAGIGAAPASHTHAWTDITSGKPTTLSGYGITDAVASSDSRLTDARTPTGSAGGDLASAYPNPTVVGLRGIPLPNPSTGWLKFSSGSFSWGSPTAADVGADADGTAASAIAAHVAEDDPHEQYVEVTDNIEWSLISTTPTTLSGYGITDAVATSDSRLSDARTPTGTAGGHLAGSYPNPTIASGVIVDSMISGAASIAWSKISKSGAVATDVGAAAISHTHAWTDITSGKPTTLSGYGITDAVVSSRTVTGVNSVTGGGDLTSNRTFQLVNDTENPGADHFYGTDGSGTRGWNSLSTIVTMVGLAGLATAAITGTLTLSKAGTTPRTATFPDASGIVVLQDGDYLDLKHNGIAPSYVEGRCYWDADDHTLALMTDVSGVTLQVGQEMHIRATNKTGSSLANGAAVYVNGAQGTRPTVALAVNSSPLANKVIGLVTYDIANNATGYVTTFGLVRGVDTSAWTEGTELFVGATAGSLTSTRPIAPAEAISIGYVLYQHAVNGVIMVTVDNGDSLSTLHDVYVSSVANNNILQYNSTTSRWENRDSLTIANTSATSIQTAGGITVAGQINGTSVVLSAGLTVGGDIVRGSGASTWELSARSAVTTIPAVVLRPKQANLTCAFDVMPNGSPTEDGNSGWAWIDVVDTDVKAGNPAMTTAHVGNTTAGVVFGSKHYNGASAKAIIFRVGSTEVGRFNSNGGLAIPQVAGISQIRAGSINIQALTATNNSWFSENSYFDGTATKYIANGRASGMRFDDGTGNFVIWTAASGLSGDTVTLNNRLVINGSTGNITMSGALTGVTTIDASSTITCTVNADSFPILYSAVNNSTGANAGSGFSFSTGDSSGYVGCFSGSYATATLADRVILGANSAASNGAGVYIPTAGQTFNIIGSGGAVTASFPTAGGLVVGASALLGSERLLVSGGGTLPAVSPTQVAISNGGIACGAGITAGASSTVSATSTSGLSLSVRNLSNGTGAFARLQIQADVAAAFNLDQFSSTYTGTSWGITLANYAVFSGASSTSNGIIIGHTADKPLIFALGSSEVARFTSGTLASGSFQVKYTGASALAVSGGVTATLATIGTQTGTNATKAVFVCDATTAAAPNHVLIGIPNTVGNRGGATFVAIDGTGVNQGSVAGFAAQIVSGTTYPNIVGRLDIVAQNGASTATVATFATASITLAAPTAVTGAITSTANADTSHLCQIINQSAGTSALAALELQNNSGSACRFRFTDYSSGVTSTAFGITLGGYVSTLALGASCNGLIIGCQSIDKPIIFGINTTVAGRFESSATADDTTLLLLDITAGTVKRVSRGAADSGGAGYRALRIPN